MLFRLSLPVYIHDAQSKSSSFRGRICLGSCPLFFQTHLAKLEASLAGRHGIYARRDVLCHTLGGNPVDILTITSTGKPNVVAKRDCIVLTSRVHPGEANSSWMMHGKIPSFLALSDAKCPRFRHNAVSTKRYQQGQGSQREVRLQDRAHVES